MSTTGNIKIRLADRTLQYNFFDTKLYGFAAIIIINKISEGCFGIGLIHSFLSIFSFLCLAGLACTCHFHAIHFSVFLYFSIENVSFSFNPIHPPHYITYFRWTPMASVCLCVHLSEWKWKHYIMRVCLKVLAVTESLRYSEKSKLEMI